MLWTMHMLHLSYVISSLAVIKFILPLYQTFPTTNYNKVLQQCKMKEIRYILYISALKYSMWLTLITIQPFSKESLCYFALMYSIVHVALYNFKPQCTIIVYLFNIILCLYQNKPKYIKWMVLVILSLLSTFIIIVYNTCPVFSELCHSRGVVVRTLKVWDRKFNHRICSILVSLYYILVVIIVFNVESITN